jgi:hypothetical protein
MYVSHAWCIVHVYCGVVEGHYTYPDPSPAHAHIFIPCSFLPLYCTIRYYAVRCSPLLFSLLPASPVLSAASVALSPHTNIVAQQQLPELSFRHLG